MSTVSIVIATSAGRGLQAGRAHDAYLRETTGPLQLLIVQGTTVPDAWQTGITMADGDIIHFGSDQLEPHPGWLETAIATIRGRRVPAPALWNVDGTEVAYARDWSSALRTAYPTMSREQLHDYGLPPLVQTDAKIVHRSGYAFTLRQD